MSLTPQGDQNTNIRNNLSPARTDRSPNRMNGLREPSPRPRRQVRTDRNDTSIPLLDTETVNTSGPPLAGPETDDEPDDRETTNAQPGVDDGFFSNNPRRNPNPDVENIPSNNQPDNKRPVIPPEQPEFGRFPPNSPRDERPEFPYAPGYGPTISIPEFAPTEFGGTESIPDVNMYQHKKTLAQGMMDLALFSANANQLRYVLESFDRHPYYYPSVILIAISLIIQVAVGIGLIWNAHYNVKDKKEICIANKISNMTIIGIFIVTVVNVFISAFGVANSPTSITIGPRSGDLMIEDNGSVASTNLE